MKPSLLMKLSFTILTSIVCREVLADPLNGKPGSDAPIEFEIAQPARRIPGTFFGVHDSRIFSVGRVKDHAAADLTAVIKDIGFEILRGPDGTPGNYFDWTAGRPINSKDPNFEQHYGKGPLWESLVPKEGYPPLTLADIFKPAAELDLPYVFNLNVCSQSVDDIIAQVREMKKLTAKPIRVELGNELYSVMHSPSFPLVSDYVKKSREVYRALKALDPGIEIAIVGVGADLEARVLGDPKNKPSGDVSIDFEATQLGRISVWNSSLKANADAYDAVTVHISPPINSIEKLSAPALMQYLFAFNVDSKAGLEKQAEYFGKDLWVTEWGYFPGALLKEKGESQDRMNFMKTPGMAVAKADRILSMLQVPAVTITAYHDLNSGNGFGIVQRNKDGIVKLPNYHVFKALGSLMQKHAFVHPLTARNNRAEKVAVLYTRHTVDLPNVSALGFGGESGPASIVFINRAGTPQLASLKNVVLKPEWTYGGADPLPHYQNNPAKFVEPPVVNPEPQVLNGPFAADVTLAPYSMTICSLKPLT